MATKPAPEAAGTPWETALLDLLGAPKTAANYRFVNAWATREHGSSFPGTLYANNPFFTTAGGGGTVGAVKAGTYPTIPNTPGVAVYPDVSTGVTITALHLGREYPGIVQALRSGNPEQFASNSTFQTELKRWSGSGYAGLNTAGASAIPQGPTLNKPILSGGGFDFSGIGHALNSGIGSGIESVVPGGPILKKGIDAAGGAANTAKQAVNDTMAVGHAIGWIFNPANILRVLEIIAGAVLVLVAVVRLTGAQKAAAPVLAARGVPA